MIKIGQLTATLSGFSMLRGCKWLTDNFINMFLRRYVQEVIPRMHCFTMHFMGELLEEEESQML